MKYEESKQAIRCLLSHVEAKILKSLSEKPSRETLDMLAILAGFQDWEGFRKEIVEGESSGNG